MSSVTKKAVKAGKYVNTGHVDTVIKNYKQERWIHNSKRIGKEDSLSVWYSVEELEDFLATIKQNGGDGVRMYFGTYDAEKAPDPLYAGRQTVVLVATKLKETVFGEANKDLYIQTDKGTNILAYNIGKLCPPFCGNGGTTTGGGIEEIGISLVDKGDGFVVV